MVLFAAQGEVGLSLGAAGKMITYSASATFHLFPFATVAAVTSSFVADIACVPFSVCGAIAPFVAVDGTDTIMRQGALAAAVLCANCVCVAWQTAGQHGLKTRSDRSDAPRSLIVTLYSLWVLAYIGIRTDFDALWAGVVAATVVAAALSQPVTEAHDVEPVGQAVPWHVVTVWSFHEDFHLALVVADALWLALALKFGG
jgi:hypothetical protein